MDIHLNQTVSKENEKSETSVEYQEAEVKGEEKTDLSGQEETSSPGRDSWKMIPELISQQEQKSNGRKSYFILTKAMVITRKGRSGCDRMVVL
jgi:hypothetical protein